MTRTRGMSTIDDLRRRSERRPGDLCWHWLGAVGSDKVPRIWTFDHDAGDKKVLPGPRAVWNIAHGEGPGKRLAYRSCFCTECVNPAHIRLAYTRAEIGQQISRSGVRKGKDVEARMGNLAKAWEALNLKVTPPEVVAALRAESGTLDQLAERHGINRSTISKIRRLESHKGISRPQDGEAPEVQMASQSGVAQVTI